MRKTLIQLASNIPAALVGGGMFIVALFLLHLGFGLSCLVAVSSYVIGGTWLFPADTDSLPQPNTPVRMTRPEILDAEYQVVTLKTLLPNIHDHEIRHAASQICEAAQQIFDAIKASSGDAKMAQQFSVYLLTPTIKIFRNALDLTAESAGFDTFGRLARLRLIFESARLAFDKQRDNMLREQHVSPDLEIAALAETLESE